MEFLRSDPVGSVRIRSDPPRREGHAVPGAELLKHVNAGIMDAWNARRPDNPASGEWFIPRLFREPVGHARRARE